MSKLLCPKCGNLNTSVKDTRVADAGRYVRRRRLCPDCGTRFTTYEHPVVGKRRRKGQAPQIEMVPRARVLMEYRLSWQA